MKELYGIPMETIMFVLLGIFAVSIASVVYVLITNRTMFKMGLRNLPRRGLQTGLVVLGLMLATLIITAAFTTGDTIDHSISSRAYQQWQRTDLNLNLRGSESEDAVGAEVHVSQTAVDALQQQFIDDPDIELFVPFLFVTGAAHDLATDLSEPKVNIVGVDAERQNQVGGLHLVDGGSFDLTTLAAEEVLVSERAAEDLDASVGDTISLFVAGKAHEVTVAGIVEDEQASGVLGDFDDVTRPGGIVLPLATAQEWAGYPGEINYISVSLNGVVYSTVNENAEVVADRVEAFVNTPDGQSILGLGNQFTAVEAVKLDDVNTAEEFGNIFTTFFLVVGLFSIAAGIMLIFMIFVMLAAERKGEMGMARAVGAQKGSLVQSFVSEGMAYNLIAGMIGAALGVAAAFGLIVGFLRWSLGEDFDFVTAHVSITSLVVSYCLGVVLTFITVVVSSIKVSSVNIVAAIRGTPEDETPEARRGVAWRWVLGGIPAMVIPPLGLWVLLRKGFKVSWTWILAPAGIALGALCVLAAKGNGSEFLFSFGVSVVPLSIAAIASHHKAPARITWTLVGAYLAAYWMAPVNVGEEVLGRKMNGDIEMFVLSGVMVVISFTLIIVFNARLLTQIFQGSDLARYRFGIGSAAAAVAAVVAGAAIGDAGDSVGQILYLIAGLLLIVGAFACIAARFPSLAPALKMGIAYPLSNRFRTGMTIAMFSMIVFSVTTFSAVNANFSAVASGEDGDGGYQVVVDEIEGSSRNLRLALGYAGAPVANDITDVGRVTQFTGSEQVRQADSTNEFTEYPVLAADSGFLSQGTTLNARAVGYESDEDVLAAVRSGQGYALLDTTPIDAWNRYEFEVDAEISDETFEPFQMALKNSATGREETVTVIGIWSSRLIDQFVSGVYLSGSDYENIYGTPVYSRSFLRLAEGVDATEAARGIEAALATEGVQAEPIRELIDESLSQDRAFTRMFQAFMALGLFVGIAALGVIAFRSVVERRQQIGMLRAIGYQTETVAATFVLESAFVAMMGILSGIVGGVIVSRNLFTIGQFSGDDIDFMMPWNEVVIFAIIAAAFSLLMTWLPSRGAARVPVADALRYE